MLFRSRQHPSLAVLVKRGVQVIGEAIILGVKRLRIDAGEPENAGQFLFRRLTGFAQRASQIFQNSQQ